MPSSMPEPDYVLVHSFFETPGLWVRSCSLCGALVSQHSAPTHTDWHKENADAHA